jgi:hypothetical protein
MPRCSFAEHDGGRATFRLPFLKPYAISTLADLLFTYWLRFTVIGDRRSIGLDNEAASEARAQPSNYCFTCALSV